MVVKSTRKQQQMNYRRTDILKHLKDKMDFFLLNMWDKIQSPCSKTKYIVEANVSLIEKMGWVLF